QITDSLKDQKEVHLVNFGCFKVVKKKKTSFINPKTKQVSHIKGEKKVKFVPSKNFIKYINEVNHGRE
ncbi:MAG: HU family DNA-binding protein, partial [Spirochaetes bacterium]|nr:HU family DNA-binding protein [Spirochaetota bacterium]